MATASGLAAAAKRVREEMLIIYVPLQPAIRRAQNIAGLLKPLSRRRA
jgi:hypothetical protein